tara:strand:- start:657 stop:1616 length:960 start_codon:yes stop_codon:yes gene_type:complete
MSVTIEMLAERISVLENQIKIINEKNLFEKTDNEIIILEKYLKKYYHKNLKGYHLTTMVDTIYMTALRCKITIKDLIKDLYNGIIDINLFRESKSGNIYKFLKNDKYKSFAERIKDITAGSNGGGANIGKGEWLISIGCGINPKTEKPYVNITKKGKGDIQYGTNEKVINAEIMKNEEMKWNGGKVSTEKMGNEVEKIFNSLTNLKGWVPFRENDKKLYSEEEVQKNNAFYWQAISNEKFEKLKDNELKEKIINMSFINVFEKSDSFIMFNDDGKFQRFYNIEEVNTYYLNKLHLLISKRGFECRANQTNPISLYCYVF